MACAGAANLLQLKWVDQAQADPYRVDVLLNLKSTGKIDALPALSVSGPRS